jgi:3-oxoacyl-[acyl-carrier protein] reductase
MTVLITGASRGIGAACARKFAENGYKVAVNYYHSDKDAAALCEEIKMHGGAAFAYKADVTDPKAVTQMIQKIKEDLGDIDALINNAGTDLRGLFTDMTDDDYDSVMDSDLRSVFNVTRAVLPQMIHNKSGSIVNISSVWGVTGASCEVLYSAAKAAVAGLTKALAKEEAPSCIRVNCIAPGVIDTSMNDFMSQDEKNELCGEIPLMRFGRPEEIAETALFLCSEKAAYITGEIIGVNGGFLI